MPSNAFPRLSMPFNAFHCISTPSNAFQCLETPNAFAFARVLEVFGRKFQINRRVNSKSSSGKRAMPLRCDSLGPRKSILGTKGPHFAEKPPA
jgi:hypothetical protein